MTDLEKELDKTLSGRSDNPEVAPLADTADRLRTSFGADVPEARGEQLLFTSGIGARKRPGLGFRLFVPVFALAAILLTLVVLARTAPPGGSLYPVRGALQAVGLAEGPIEDVEQELTEARHDLARGENLLATDPDDAVDHAFDAMDALQDVRELLPDLNGDQRAVYRAQIDSLELRAEELIGKALRAEAREERREDRLDDDDNSGPGSGDDDGDSSGPGSGDDDSDSSGSG